MHDNFCPMIICSHHHFNAACVTLYIQAFISILVLIFSGWMMAENSGQASCSSDMALYASLLSSIIAYWLPSPLSTFDNKTNNKPLGETV